MILLELVVVFLLGWALAHADIGLRRAREVIEDMPLPPYDQEAEAPWEDIADSRPARG